MSESPFSPSNTVLELTKLIVLMSSTVQVVLLAILTLRHFQQQQIQSLNKACSYQTEIVLDILSKQELLCWDENLRLNNGRSLRQKEQNLVIQTDTSKLGWGNLLQQGVNYERTVRKAGEFAYICSGINSSKVCHANIQKRTMKYTDSLPDRQQDCILIFFENGGADSQQRRIAHQQVRLKLTAHQTNCTACRVPSRCPQYTCRLGFTIHQGQFRMETRCSRFSRDCSTHWTTSSGFPCIQTQPPTSTMHSMETRPGQYSNRCVPSSMGQGVQFRFSPIPIDKSGSEQDPQRKDRLSNHEKLMANSALV